MIDKYNEKYSTIDESTKKILKVLISSTDDEKKEVYTKMVKECIETINEKLKDSDLDTKDRLLSVKDKLLNDDKEINEDFIKNMSKLVSLKESLNE
jgi:Na+/phosphate symporter